MMIDTALIFAAGRGERLMPYTKTNPKPMLLIDNKPLIEHHLNRLSACGIKQVVINLAYLGYKIKHYFGNGQSFGLHIEYLPEPPGGLETGGTLAYLVKTHRIQDDSTILCLNGDIHTDYQPNPQIELLDSCNGHLILIPEHEEKPPANFGWSPNTHCIETHPKKYIFSGIAYYRCKALKDLPLGRYSIRDWLYEQTANKALTGEVFNGFWQDIGSPAILKKFIR